MRARLVAEFVLLALASWVVLIAFVGAAVWTADQLVTSSGLALIAVALAAAALLVALLAWRKPRPPFEPGDFL